MPYIQLEISKAEVEPGLVGFCGPLRRLDCSGPSSPPSLRAKMRAINVDGTQNIAVICKTLDCKLVYLSTNYVFYGFGEAFWPPDFNPLNVYGQSKLDGEQSIA